MEPDRIGPTGWLTVGGATAPSTLRSATPTFARFGRFLASKRKFIDVFQFHAYYQKTFFVTSRSGCCQVVIGHNRTRLTPPAPLPSDRQRWFAPGDVTCTADAAQPMGVAAICPDGRRSRAVSARTPAAHNTARSSAASVPSRSEAGRPDRVMCTYSQLSLTGAFDESFVGIRCPHDAAANRTEAQIAPDQ